MNRPDITVQEFKNGDQILIRPEFSHLYPYDSGVIVATLLDPLRSLFNEYTIEFPDRTTAGLFQFQLFPVSSR